MERSTTTYKRDKLGWTIYKDRLGDPKQYQILLWKLQNMWK